MNIKIGGVPEHFNFVWHEIINSKVLEKQNIQIEWSDEASGTGAMCQKLTDRSLDLAVILTEGFIQKFHQGAPIQMVQQYIKSPLIWGVHNRPGFKDTLENTRFAISRKGSGSHIMAYVHADNKNAQIKEDQFVVVNTIQGAMKAFENNEADVILWEKFTTQPYVDQGVVERNDECISPWPCFVLAGNSTFLKEHREIVSTLGQEVFHFANELMNDETAIERIAKRYHLDQSQVKTWFHLTEWQLSPWVSKKVLNNVQNTLHRLDLIENILDPQDYCRPKTPIY